MKTIKEKPTAKTRQPASSSKASTKKDAVRAKDQTPEEENEEKKSLPINGSNVNKPNRFDKSATHESILDEDDEVDDEVKEMGLENETEDSDTEFNDLDDEEFDEEEDDEEDFEDDVDEEDDDADHGRKSYKR